MVNESAGGEVCATKGQEFVFREFSLRIEQLFPLLAVNEISVLQRLAKQFTPFIIYAATSLRAMECHRLIAEVPAELNLAHRAHLLRVAATILCDESQTLRQSCGWLNQAEKNVSDLFQTLTADQLLNFSVSQLATKFRCGRRQLNRIFHQYFDMSVASLKMEMRLLKASWLLRDLNAKVIDVAAECGFNHLGLFNTCFRKRFGTTPSGWRRIEVSKGPRPPKAGLDSRRLPLLQTRESWLRNVPATDRARPAQRQVRIENVVESTILPDQQERTAATDPAKSPKVVGAVKEGSKGLSFKIQRQL